MYEDIAAFFATCIYPIISGAFSGLIVAGLGYFKSTPEEFDAQKFFVTVGIGAVVGGVAGYTGMDYMSAQAWLISIGAITATEYFLKAIWRRFAVSKKQIVEEPTESKC